MAGLPKISISYLNGMLGTVSDSADGFFAIVVGATAVSTTFSLNTPKTITRIDDLKKYGITSTNNAALYKAVKEFYDEAPDGTQVVIMGVDKSTETGKKKSELCANTEDGIIRNLIVSMNGKLKGIFLGSNKSENTSDAVAAAQTLAEWATNSLYAPLFFVFDCDAQDEDDLVDFSDAEYNRVAILLGDTAASTATSAIGLLAGRLASIGVQRNCGRVKDGVLSPSQMYVIQGKAEDEQSLITTAYDCGYIVPRTYVGRSGYFFADDQMACDPTDDYSHISLRRVIDKAYRITYDTLLDMMLDELEVNEDGTLQLGVIKSWQAAVEGAINRSMTANGELSATDGEGCSCFIDEKQNVVSTSKINVTVKVRPFGYARYIDVNLGFQVTNS